MHFCLHNYLGLNQTRYTIGTVNNWNRSQVRLTSYKIILKSYLAIELCNFCVWTHFGKFIIVLNNLKLTILAICVHVLIELRTTFCDAVWPCSWRVKWLEQIVFSCGRYFMLFLKPFQADLLVMFKILEHTIEHRIQFICYYHYFLN